jgi:Flp pilus assembly pilin Flp
VTLVIIIPVTTVSAAPPNGPLLDARPGRILVPVANKSKRASRCECFLLVPGATYPQGLEGDNVTNLLRRLWSEEQGQDIAEYAVMLAVILVIVVGTIRLIGGNANNVFSSVSSSIGS